MDGKQNSDTAIDENARKVMIGIEAFIIEQVFMGSPPCSDEAVRDPKQIMPGMTNTDTVSHDCYGARCEWDPR
jgi:hypothetical protein